MGRFDAFFAAKTGTDRSDAKPVPSNSRATFPVMRGQGKWHPGKSITTGLMEREPERSTCIHTPAFPVCGQTACGYSRRSPSWNFPPLVKLPRGAHSWEQHLVAPRPVTVPDENHSRLDHGRANRKDAPFFLHSQCSALFEPFSLAVFF